MTKGDRDSDILVPASSSEEREAAQALAHALSRGQEPVFEMLVAAHRPEPLDAAVHEAIVHRALGAAQPEDGSFDAPATSAERAEAHCLREALDDPGSEQPAAAELAAVLRAAHRPGALAPLRNEALIAKALGRARSRPPRRIAAVTMAALAGVTALAAGLALFITRSVMDPEQFADAPVSAEASHAALSRSRSTLDLFDPFTPFAKTGGQSARIDRIASARAAELRENRFAMWGVR